MQSTRRNNWHEVIKLMRRKGVEFPPLLVEGTINMEHGAANALAEFLYEKLSNRK